MWTYLPISIPPSPADKTQKSSILALSSIEIFLVLYNEHLSEIRTFLPKNLKKFSGFIF